MSNITSARNYSSFVKECRFFFCQTVYEGDWDGKEKYIVSSDTAEEVLWEKYPEIMRALSPYLFCNAACGDVYAESLKNIGKFEKRKSNTISFGDTADIEHLIEFDVPEMEAKMLIEEGLSACTPIQRERIQKYYMDGMTLSQIAEGKNVSSVQQSIVAGMKRIKKYFEVHP